MECFKKERTFEVVLTKEVNVCESSEIRRFRKKFRKVRKSHLQLQGNDWVTVKVTLEMRERCPDWGGISRCEVCASLWFWERRE